MRLYELILDNEEEDGVFALSFVENPAIEMDFVYFGEEYKFQSINDEKRLVVGPILVPNKKILRVDGAGVPYEVYLSEDTVSKIAHNYMKNGYQNEATLEHDKKVDGISLVESWVVESREKDKSKLYNMTLPLGSWAGVFKIDNDEMWNEYIKTGKVKGISIEGVFEHLEKTTPERKESAMLMESFADYIMQKNIEELSEKEANYVLSKIKAVIKKDKRFEKKIRIEMESFSDYGDEVKANAKRGIELNEKNNNKCGTQVGKVRAQQLANGEPISLETIKRMHSFLNRAESYYDEADSQNDCGYISYLLWGGKSALSWSRNKLRELGELVEAESIQPSIDSSYPGQTPESGSYTSPATFQDEYINIYGYIPEYFHICPGAVGTFNHLVNEMDIQEKDLQDMIRAAAVIADNVFDIEEDALEDGSVEEKDLERAKVLVDMFKDIFLTISERTGMDHDISYMDGHIKVLEEIYANRGLEQNG